jgi:hypothetical protein
VSPRAGERPAAAAARNAGVTRTRLDQNGPAAPGSFAGADTAKKRRGFRRGAAQRIPSVPRKAKGRQGEKGQQNDDDEKEDAGAEAQLKPRKNTKTRLKNDDEKDAPSDETKSARATTTTKKAREDDSVWSSTNKRV